MFEGSYTQFLEEGGWGTDLTKPVSSSKKPPSPSGTSGAPLSKKDQRRKRAEFNQRKREALGGLEKAIAAVEKDIAHLEDRLTLETSQLTEAAEKQDVKGMSVLAQTSGQLRKQVKALYDRLGQLAQQHQEAEKAFLEEAKMFESDSN